VVKIKPRYSTTVTVSGGREGRAVSDDGNLDVQLRRPKTNGVAEGTNPEQLFAAAWAACYQQALIGVAKDAGEDASDSTVSVDVTIGAAPEGGSGLAAKITVEIPGLHDSRVQELAEAANEACPYSKATKGNIDVEILAAEPVAAD
jgi:Ohr subfamily peroxiredoxin